MRNMGIYTGRRPRGQGGMIIRILVIAAIIWILVQMFWRGDRSRPRETAPPPPPSAQIAQRLRPASPVEPRPGIAAAVLVDTSGSMGESVPDADGRSKPKIEIARDSVIKLIEMTERFAGEHPDKTVLLAVYEFSSGVPGLCREVVPLAPPSVESARAAVQNMSPSGGTPIGEAMIVAKRKLDASGIMRQHMLVVTDGENNQGHAPGEVLRAMTSVEQSLPASVYFVAFDVAAAKFNSVRDAGAMVLSASNEHQLRSTIDTVLTERILVE